MQTFLPHAGFAASAQVLDDRRLGKQRVETLQILRALVWPEYGWKHHPAVAMWRGFVPALVGYGVAICREWRERGYSDAVLPALLEFTGGRVPEEPELCAGDLMPPWLGAEPLHDSHRSSLLRKDAAHYLAHFPEVPEHLPYVWPQPVFPRWPLRRGRPEPLSPREALALLGLEEAPTGYLEAVERVSRGEGAEVHPTAPGDTTAGLLAGLCTPGETLWLLTGTPPAEVTVTGGTGSAGVIGTASASVARRPGPEDVAAMRAEAEAAPEFRFRRIPPGAGAVHIPERVGLVVVADAEIIPPPDGPPVLRLSGEGTAWTGA
ncbi:MSMEG_6728 family protein [Marinactinospora thermotolerans]|uniref:Uncharacterized protein n=1 Tax=Marinactinospora thermotolerans DSM 45154 TaxID=1122192 RepID=A0A1T4RTH3_9ACTN|nr:MSMEG_6728 family protein [Marinactinospora thermotolerans]SKA18901.1 hypothetical protein SAMN02745673_02940 [Marinactinospora thermotolerans DSM 45154]